MRSKANLAGYLISILGVLIAAVFTELLLYFQNIEEVAFIEVLPVLFCFIVLGLLLFGLIMLIMRKPEKASIITIFAIMVIINYTFIEEGIQSIVSTLKYWHIVPILLVLFIFLSILFCKKVPDEICKILLLTILITFSSMLIINFFASIPTINAKSRAKQNNNQYFERREENKNEELPNIYYLLFDEYSSYDFMLKYYNYDNGAFLDKLKNQGFSISYNSHNESVSTVTVTANLMNLEYIVNDSWPAYEKDEARKNGKLYEILLNHGYRLFSLTDSYGLPVIDQQHETSKAMTVSGETLGDIIIQKSIFYPFITVNRQGLQSTIENIKSFICKEEKNRFLIVHLELPHQPFIYDRDGNIIENVNTDWKNKQYYLNQYIYATKVMEDLVNCIIKHDSKSVIILQSDHSARASTDPDIFKKVFTMEDMTNCFNCVYYMGEPIEIEGLSGINTERLVLEKLLGEELPQIDVPILKENGFTEGV